MKRLTWLAAICAFCGISAQAGNAFYWRGGTSWGDWSDPTKWSLTNGANDNPSSLTPTAEDTIVCTGTTMSGQSGDYRRFGLINLGGETRETAGFALVSGVTTPWKQYWIDLTNGTLQVGAYPYTVDKESITERFTIWNGATLKVMGDPKSVLGRSGLAAVWNVKKGGAAELDVNFATSFVFQVSVEAGGRMLFAPKSFGVHPSADKRFANYISTSGDLYLPRGVIWNDKCGSLYAFGRSFEVNVYNGRVFLGGDVAKTFVSTAAAEPLNFKFYTSQLIVTNAVAFIPTSTSFGESVTATVLAGYTLTVDVQEDSSLDATIFTYGASASVVKQGPGVMKLGAAIPPALAVQAGTVVFGGVQAAGAAVSLSADAEVRFDAKGNSMPTAPTGYAQASFSLATANFTEPCTLLESSDADFLAYVAAQIAATVPAGMAASVREGRLLLVTASGDIFRSNGELELSEATGWSSGATPVGNDVVVSGPDTVAVITGATPEFRSITLEDGATLKVSGTGIYLPPVTLTYPSRLLVTGGSEMNLTNAITGRGDALGLPVIEIETNAVVAAARKTRFRNVDLRLYGLIEIPNDASGTGGLYFGYASERETTYFAMTAIGGTISIPKNTGVNDAAWKWFVAPQPDGRVIVQRPILLKDVKFNRNRDGSAFSAYNGAYVGYGNPTNLPFEFILDGTDLPLGRLNYIGGAATVRCVNGGRVVSATYHSGVTTRFEMKAAGRVVAEGLGSGICYYHSGVADNVQHSPLVLTSDALDGQPEIELVNGASMAAHETSGGGAAVLAVSNGVWQVPMLPYVPPELSQYLPSGDPRDWMVDAFTGFKEVRVAAGADLYLASVDVLGASGNAAAACRWNRDVKLAAVPIVGAGGLLMTNCTPGYAFRATVTAGDNTAAGVATAFPGTGGEETTLLFADGANWAGTVAANGHVALTNVTDGAAPATVSFGALRLDGALPLRVWAETNDMVNLSGPIAGTGAVRPVAMDGRAFVEGETIVLGTIPADAAFPAKSGRDWSFRSEPTADPATVKLLLKYTPPGTHIILR